MKTSIIIEFISCMLLITIFTGCSDTTGPEKETYTIYLSGNITEDTRLSVDKTYYLTGQTFVNEGVTLTIDPGVTIEAIPYDKNGLPTALIIDRGARIIAEGTDNTVPAILECVRCYTTEGEIVDVLRSVFGEYQEPVIL